MPYSSDSGKKFTDRAINRLLIELGEGFFTTRKILDIGAGSGTYSNLYSTTLLPRSKFSWEAVEIWEPYVEKFGLKQKYDQVHITDGISFLKPDKNADEVYDVIFMGDVVEHMTKEQAVEMVSLAQKICKLIIISIPIIHYPQDEYEGNPYEAHVKDDWSTQEVLDTFTNIVSYGVENEIGVFLIASDDHLNLAHVLGPKIGIYAIGKNELKFADRFFSSIIPADQIVICDTGSTDGTYEFLKRQEEAMYIAEASTGINQYGPPGMIVEKIAVMPFRFDDARNTAMMMLRSDLDLCISIDFDELLETNWYEYLSTLVTDELHTQGYVTDRWNHRFKTIWDWDTNGANVTEHWHERIHTRHNYLWKLPVHEVLVKQGSPENIKWLNDFTMIQKPDTTKSRSSYLKLLEVSLKEDPTRWKSWTFYAGDLAAAGRVQEAIDATKKSKECPNADQAYLCNALSRYYMALGFHREAVIESTNAAMIASHLREYKVYLAKLHLQLGDKAKARSMLDLAETITERTYGYEYDASCWGEAFEQLKEQAR